MRRLVPALVVLLLACDGQIEPIPGEFDVGPGGDAGPMDGATPDVNVSGCDSPEGFFNNYLWPQVLQAVCIDCHIEGGDAASEGAFVLTPSFGTPGYLEANYAVAAALAAEASEVEGMSLLTAKPSGTVMHGGGSPAPEGGRIYALLEGFVQRVEEGGEDGEGCEVPSTCDGIVFAEPVETLRKASLSLVGRLPREEEIAAVRAGGLPALDEAVAAMLDEEAFVLRAQEGFSDIFLIEGYDAIGGGLLSYDNYVDRSWGERVDEYRFPPVPVDPDDIYRIGRDYDIALRNEPNALIGHIVRNDRSFQEVLTANYMMASPYTARSYGIFEAMNGAGLFTDPSDPFEYVETRLPAHVTREGRAQVTPDGFFPHAGILTTEQWLNRYPSTDTNRNRGRVRAFYLQFLGVDILSLSQPEDSATAMGADNPTMEVPACVGCHSLMDPIAGLFQHYLNPGHFDVQRVPHTRGDDPEVLNGDEWYTDMFPPGFHGEDFPAEEEWRALQWLGERTVADPRFALTMATHALYILTQTPTLRAPIDREDPLYRERLNGFNARRGAIEDAATALVDSGFNIKAAFRSLVMSDIYRATDYEGEESRACDTELEAFGLWTLLTPEQLNQKFEAILGRRATNVEPFAEPYRQAGVRPRSPNAENQYTLYGGLDRSAITQRQTTPNAVTGAVIIRNAQSMACDLIPPALTGDGTGPVSLFLDGVNSSTRDEAAIHANIQYWHELILGHYLAPGDADLERTYQLFETIRSEGAARVAAGAERGMTPFTCGDMPDDAYVIRAWMATLTYLLRRPEFLLQ